MKPIQQHKDPRITNISFDNFTGSVYIINPETNDENHNQSMLTSPRTNAADHFVPSHHLALITQPVLGARSRSRKKTTKNIIVETKDKFDSMANSRRGSYNDSPPLILPMNRVDTSQYQKKTNSNSHHESSDSGLDLSSSTNSSVQLQQYPQQHIIIHRPLSALNEDSSPDDGYHDEHEQAPLNTVRLRFPPVNFGRNRSMEDIVSNNKREQQHRSSSFTDERQRKLSLQEEKKMKRSSDGALLDLLDTASDTYRRSNTIKNELLYPSTTQHRSLNDLTNKTSNRVLPIRNESNMSTSINNLSTTQTIIRKPNTSTLKPLRKKTKLNIIIEPSVPLTSSRLAIYDEQINAMTGTTSSSSNQTTPRLTYPPAQQQQQQQQIKSKATTPLGYYPNQEQLRAHVNRSVVERQHPPAPSRRGVIKQLIPFDASPSKVNNLLLRHHVHQHQPITIFHPNSNIQLSPSRQVKQTSRILYNEETISNHEEQKRKQKEQIKIENFKEQLEKQHLKQKEEVENNKLNENYRKGQRRIKDNQQTFTQRHFIKSIQKQQDKELSFEKNQKKKIEKNRFIQKNENIDERKQTEQIFTSTPRQQYEQTDLESYYRHPNRNITRERYGSGQSSTTTGKLQDTKNTNRQQQRNAHYVDDSNHKNRSDGLDKKQRIYESKPTEFILQNKTHKNINEKKLSRISEPNNQYEFDYSQSTQKNTLAGLQSRPSKVHFQPFETTPSRNSILLTQIDPNRSKHGNDYHTWQKSQTGSMSKTIPIQPILSSNTNTSNSRRERETSQLSNLSKTDSVQFKQKIIDKNSHESLQSKSPTSWSIRSEHQNDQQQFDIYNKNQSESPSFQDEFIENNSSTPSRTYRLMINDQEQSLDGRYVIPSNNSQTPSHIDHTYPYTLTPNGENNMLDNTSPSKQKSIVSDVYTLSDRVSTHTTIDRETSLSPPVHHSSKKNFYSPPPPPPSKTIMSTDKDEILSINDSDDGWSDDSAELLYVDERYATEKRKMTPSSHLSSQQHYHYQVQQQNVLLQ